MPLLKRSKVKICESLENKNLKKLSSFKSEFFFFSAEVFSNEFKPEWKTFELVFFVSKLFGWDSVEHERCLFCLQMKKKTWIQFKDTENEV